MKKLGTIIVLLVVSMTLLTSCGSASAVLCISHSSWSGATSGAEEKVTSESYEVKKGDTIELSGMSDLSVTIVSVSGDKIVFETNSPMSDRDDGTVDLNTNKTRFELGIGEQLTLSTLTMDAGDNYVFELQKDENSKRD